ncbi:xanthine dehydrogenase accessory protein XdhC [Reinekea blandensis]|uniref:Xanthine and CO dehydrogenase maturation factor, XdhC/CoxF family protein n=1 Tax=Reinekea blandensis MED297 TaxID=314283 RepID=A4BCZ8_9GAMM|nr:xanthine dehydrogenase accessory protein XdhC [Reinekea blandensis]EAR10080.1 Xanthine and CO dehydrogenase maturation factor, XdhC/CoxF family protein [Reinekea sp. MED297] [Reinekea blandensis MED297]
MLNKHTQGFHPQTWSQAIAQLETQSVPYVLVTILGTAGSTPREQGTKMVVTAEDIFDTVGGGHLEFRIVEQARAQLIEGQSAQDLQHFPLGASLGQCCGGSVSVLFECFVPERLPVDVYGAGHVGQALISLLAGLPVRVRWIDARAELFPPTLPANVQTIVEPQPEDAVADAQPGTATVVLTHNHQLDFAIVEKALRQGASAFLGVIGSDTKAKRFRMRLAHKGFTDEQIANLTCPIGLSEVPGKRPMEVAISIAGQLIQQYQNELPNAQREGLQWRELRGVLQADEPTLVEVNHD